MSTYTEKGPIARSRRAVEGDADLGRRVLDAMAVTP
jgi:hypothetical protein